MAARASKKRSATEAVERRLQEDRAVLEFVAHPRPGKKLRSPSGGKRDSRGNLLSDFLGHSISEKEFFEHIWTQKALIVRHDACIDEARKISPDKYCIPLIQEYL